MMRGCCGNDYPDLPELQKGTLFDGCVSVVLPCLNEAETLEGCIREALHAEQFERPKEIIVADNGSTDGSQEIAERLGAKVVSVATKGYGAALMGGVEASDAEYIVMGDADGSYDFSHLSRFIAKLDEGYDLVIGNRFAGGIQPGAMPWKHRYIGNPVLSFIGRLFFHCPARDFHCGLRAFTRDAYNRMELNTTGMEFASEMVIKATLKGMRIAEVPTILRPDGRSRPPHLRSWRDGWRHLRFMLLFSPKWLFTIPGSLLSSLGLLAMIVFAVWGPLTVNRVGLSVNSCVMAAMTVILGYQLLIAGSFASRFGRIVGTHPKPPDRIPESHHRLEWGIVMGLCCTLLGSLAIITAIWVWWGAGFGPMSAGLTLRWGIPGCTMIVVGAQTVFGSFLLNLLSFAGKQPLPKSSLQ